MPLNAQLSDHDLERKDVSLQVRILKRKKNYAFHLSISISATESKTVWFYFPIMILLSINALMFTFAVSKVCSLSKAEKKLGLRSGDRNQNMEK